jgi:hypothetical protein
VFLAPLGWLAVFGPLINLWEEPRSLAHWLTAAVGIAFGGLMGTFCSAFLVELFLSSIVPSRLRADSRTLHVRVWIELPEGTARDVFWPGRVSIPREDLVGVELFPAQGGGYMLFLVHASGMRFHVGWQGSMRRAERLAQPVLRWIEGGRRSRS